MDESTLSYFEQQVDALLSDYQQLKQKNTKLRNKQSELLVQQNKTSQMKKTMIQAIESIIKKLEKLEKNHD